MRVFLINCLERGIFDSFFQERDAELNTAVEALFLEHFASAFEQDGIAVGEADYGTLTGLISEKFAGDDHL